MNFSDTAAFEYHLKMSRVSKGVFALNGYTICRSLDNLDVSADQTNISCIVSIYNCTNTYHSFCKGRHKSIL